jgi:two-component system OmpR family response regulator
VAEEGRNMVDGTLQHLSVRWLPPKPVRHPQAYPDRCDILVFNGPEGLPGTISRALRRHGFSVVEAGSSEHAALACTYLSPEFVLLNLQLPDPAGLALIQQLCAARQGSRPAVIVYTGSDDSDDALDALDAGADAVLTPPFSLEALLQLIYSKQFTEGTQSR